MKSFKQYLEEVKKPTGKLKDACWKGYTAVGTKQKGGRTVPNCVPEEFTAEEIFDTLEEMIEEVSLKHNVAHCRNVKTTMKTFKEFLDESAAWQRKAGKDPEGGLNRKGIASYRRENPGSKLSMAVTTKPSKLKPGSKSANRRKSFCARMGGMEGAMKKPNGEPTRKALALRKWNC